MPSAFCASFEGQAFDLEEHAAGPDDAAQWSGRPYPYPCGSRGVLGDRLVGKILTQKLPPFSGARLIVTRVDSIWRAVIHLARAP